MNRIRRKFLISISAIALTCLATSFIVSCGNNLNTNQEGTTNPKPIEPEENGSGGSNSSTTDPEDKPSTDDSNSNTNPIPSQPTTPTLIIELKKNTFNASEFLLSDKTIKDAKNQINSDWIFQNKETLFKNSSSLKLVDITSFNLVDENDTSLQINVIIGGKSLNFSITNFKKEVQPDQPSVITPPKTLDELRSTNPNDIAKLSSYSSRDFGIVVKPEVQSGPICWAYGFAGASEVSILREGLNNYTTDGANGSKILNLDELEVDKITNIRETNDDELGYSSYEYYANDLRSGGHAFYAANAFTQKNFLDKNLVLENYIIPNKVDASNRTTIDSIKKLIATYGAVACEYNSDNGKYGSWSRLHNTGLPDHGVCIIGWDDTIKKDSFQSPYGISQPTRDGAWIIKNSWGASSGRGDGCFYLSYDSSISQIIAFDYGLLSEYENKYYYDGSDFLKRAVPEWKYRRKAASIFKAKKSTNATKEKINAIQFGIDSGNNVQIEAKIYKNVKTDLNPYSENSSMNNPESGQLIAKQVQTYEYPGIYTMKLNNPIYLEPNETFSVVISVLSSDTPGEEPSLLFAREEKSYNDMSYVFDLDTNEWINTISKDSKYVARIRAITKTEPIPNATLNNDLKYAMVTLTDQDYKTIYRYKDASKGPTPKVIFNKIELQKNIDYDVQYETPTFFTPLSGSKDHAVGWGKMKILGKGKFANSFTEASYPILLANYPELKCFENLGWSVLIENEGHRITISIPKNSYSNLSNWSQIPLPENWVWAFENNQPIEKENYIKYIGSDVLMYYQGTFINAKLV